MLVGLQWLLLKTLIQGFLYENKDTQPIIQEIVYSVYMKVISNEKTAHITGQSGLIY